MVSWFIICVCVYQQKSVWLHNRNREHELLVTCTICTNTLYLDEKDRKWEMKINVNHSHTLVTFYTRDSPLFMRLADKLFLGVKEPRHHHS